MRVVSQLGERVWSQWDELRHAAAVIGTVMAGSVRPSCWARSARELLARQVFAMGVESLALVGAVAMFVGMSVVVQLTFWVGEAGQSQMLGPLLVAVVARELGPLLINLVVIVRSGSAMTTELAIFRINGEVRALQERGHEPFSNLVLPRVLGMAASTFFLTIVFILAAFASGFLVAAFTGKGSRDLLWFADTISSSVLPKDVFNILGKSILPGLFAGVSCCVAGLGVDGSLADIPGATQRALTRSVVGLFVISAVISLLTYL